MFVLLPQESHIREDGSLRRCSAEFSLFGKHVCTPDPDAHAWPPPPPPQVSVSAAEVEHAAPRFIICSHVRIPLTLQFPTHRPDALPIYSAPVVKMFTLNGRGLGSRYFLALNSLGFGSVIDPRGQLCMTVPLGTGTALEVAAACAHPTLPFVSFVARSGCVYHNCCLPTLRSALKTGDKESGSRAQDTVIPPSNLSQFVINRQGNAVQPKYFAYNSTGTALYLSCDHPGLQGDQAFSIYWFSLSLSGNNRTPIMRIPIQSWTRVTVMLPCPNKKKDSLLLILGQATEGEGRVTCSGTILCTAVPRVHASFHLISEYHDSDAELCCSCWSQDGELIAIGDNHGVVSVWCVRSVPAMYEIQAVRFCRQRKTVGQNMSSMNDLIEIFRQKMRKRIRSQGSQNPDETEDFAQFCQRPNTCFIVPVAHFIADGPVRHISVTSCQESNNYLVAYSTHGHMASLTVRSVHVKVPLELTPDIIQEYLSGKFRPHIQFSYDEQEGGAPPDNQAPILLRMKRPLTGEIVSGSGHATSAGDDFSNGALSKCAESFNSLYLQWCSNRAVSAVTQDVAWSPACLEPEGPWITHLEWSGPVLVAVTRDRVVKCYAQSESQFNEALQGQDEWIRITHTDLTSIKEGYIQQQPVVCTGPQIETAVDLPHAMEPLMLMAIERMRDDTPRFTCQIDDTIHIASLLGIQNPTADSVAETCYSPGGFTSAVAIHSHPLSISVGDAAGRVDLFLPSPVNKQNP